MSQNETVLRFDNLSFEYSFEKPILDEVSFSIRRGTKIALMGQNGGGKSTLFKLITKGLTPTSGQILVDQKFTVATAQQVMNREYFELTTLEYFKKHLDAPDHEVKQKMSEVLDIVNLEAPQDRIIKEYSGGQQARLLLAAALIQDPDLLLLDEPTNNLDHDGIEHLTLFLTYYPKTFMVISHDAEFLNAFTDGVLYLDTFTKKIEQYTGNYHDVVEQIAARIEKENRQNARMEKEIQENKDKANFFAHKGGKMRLVAKKMRERAEDLEAEKVDVRREDKTIRPFVIPTQPDMSGPIVEINSFTVMQKGEEVTKEKRILLSKNEHLLVSGPNGIGKSTFIEALATGKATGAVITPGINIGYYRQDFSTLNFNHTVRESLFEALELGHRVVKEEELRAVAAGFLITSDLMNNAIHSLSEGQKGLVSFARLVLQQPGLLILDEPTNHINFRHLPIIAKALDQFEGAMILVSHTPEFVEQIRIDRELNLAR